MRRNLLLGAALVTGLSLTACGGGQGADNRAAAGAATSGDAVASTGKTVDACSLISAEEMQAITTDKVSQIQPTDPGSCNYKSGQDDGLQLKAFASGGAKQMEIVHKTGELLGGMGQAVADKGGAGKDVNAKLQQDKSAAPAIGDEAVWETNDTLAVRKGDMFVEVSPPIMHDPANHSGYPLIPTQEKRAIAEKVATKLLEKLAQH